MSLAGNKTTYRKLLRKKLDISEVENLLAPAQFHDWQAAYSSLTRIANKFKLHDFLADLFPTLFTILENAAYPDRALINLERFIERSENRLELLQSFQGESRTIELLITLFSGSQFLSEILLLHPEFFELIKDSRSLSSPKSKEQLFLQAQEMTSHHSDSADQLDALRQFQRLEILRIGAGDLTNLIDLQLVVAQLSDLADALIEHCLRIVAANLNLPTDGFAVIALGKLGGRELNYSSDIDLLFLCREDSRERQRLGEKLVGELTRSTEYGFLYRVDVSLRPWGTSGKLVPTLDEHIHYLKRQARLWEKQAMLKARFVAGDDSPGNEFLRESKPLIFDLAKQPLQESIYGMKARIEQQLNQKGQGWGEVKSGVGSIRDVEFLTQYLQLLHGAKHPEIRSRNTLDALDRLASCQILPIHEYRVLADGYTFLRTVEHHLQIMHYWQTHSLPKDSRELNYLARRLGFQGLDMGKQLMQRYQQHRDAIRSIYLHYLGNEKVRKQTGYSPSLFDSDHSAHISRMDRSYPETFSDDEIRRHAELVEQLSDERLVAMDAAPLENDAWRITIVAYDYFGELSIICGLLFVYGLNIIDGNIFTYEPAEDVESGKKFSSQIKYQGEQLPHSQRVTGRRKIVDVFTVQPVSGKIAPGLWEEYREELSQLLRLLRLKHYSEAQGYLARRVAGAIPKYVPAAEKLLPVEIEIDNSVSMNYTLLRIDAPDTIGFLYEFTNALTLNGIYISRVMVSSFGHRVHDTLFVTDGKGQKITDPRVQHQLRVATVLVKHFTHLLPRSSNPESALLHFRELISRLFASPDWQIRLVSLERPEVLNALVKLLGVSDFLWDDFLRMQHENLFPVIRDPEKLKTAKSKTALRKELAENLEVAGDNTAKRSILNEFKDREIFRIDMRYILGHTGDFRKFSRELSALAEVVVEAAYQICLNQLVKRFGRPKLEDKKKCRAALCAMGKFGGRELGFASDIELLFIYEGKGQTSGKKKINNAEFFEKLVEEFTRTIKTKHEGIFEVDLQLRPYGKAGSKAVSLESFEKYFSPKGAAWEYERQALVKLRPVAGDQHLGKRLTSLRDRFLYENKSYDITAMRAIRERQMRELVAGGTINAKFSSGGLVDLEYLVQALQIMHGHKHPSLKNPNTHKALAALLEQKIISEADYQQLNKAHLFLRRLIEALRMVRGSAKELNVPPPDSQEFAFLAKRLDYDDPVQLWNDIMNYTNAVQRINRRVLR